MENKVRANGRKLFKSHDTRITESDLDNILRELQKEERISDQEQGEFILRSRGRPLHYMYPNRKCTPKTLC